VNISSKDRSKRQQARLQRLQNQVERAEYKATAWYDRPTSGFSPSHGLPAYAHKDPDAYEDSLMERLDKAEEMLNKPWYDRPIHRTFG